MSAQKTTRQKAGTVEENPVRLDKEKVIIKIEYSAPYVVCGHRKTTNVFG
ncbi:hypothetical protein ACFQGI_12470 [Halobellus sp. GCM10025813]